VTRFGFHASHEETGPGALLRDTQQAERAGFPAAMCSDHFAPWSRAQGQSGFAWSWLGAALATTDLPFGVVTAPGQRYHPAVHAQAIATLGQMFPGRFWAALGSGQALNEHITGDRWPRKSERNARLRECADVIRALLAGEEVTHTGRVTVDRARLWSRPEQPPALLAAATTPATARWAGEWADGLITVNAPVETLREVVGAFREGGGGGPVHLQVHVCWADDDEAALRQAHALWAPVVLGGDVAWDLETPADFEQMAGFVRPDDLHPSVLAGSDPQQHVAWLQELAGLGLFDDVYVHHVGHEHRGFLDVYGEHVLPALADR
jgi:probable non-F420 flavinoid oxidoreductase